MRNEPCHSDDDLERCIARMRDAAPRPSPQFRRRAWLLFQRALDPLAPPKPLRKWRQH